MMKLKFLVFGVSLFCSWVALASGNIEAGKAKSAACVACHNADGNSTVPAWPKIAGQYPNYIISQLLEFKKGEAGKRYEPQMLGMVANLSEQDMEDLAAYFASQEQTPGKALPDYIELGQKIYRGGNHKSGVTACAACHGPKGQGNFLAKYPRLSGQHPEYIELQLKNFKAGKRKNDPNGIMRDIAMRMTDEEMKAVSEYVVGLN